MTLDDWTIAWDVGLLARCSYRVWRPICSTISVSPMLVPAPCAPSGVGAGPMACPWFWINVRLADGVRVPNLPIMGVG